MYTASSLIYEYTCLSASKIHKIVAYILEQCNTLQGTFLDDDLSLSFHSSLFSRLFSLLFSSELGKVE